MKKMTAIILAALSVNMSFAADNKITLEGSTTVLPIAQKAAEAYMKKNPDISVTVRGGGSGVGIVSLIDGTCDIADSSRPIKQKELDNAFKKSKKLKAHIIAMDAIVIAVNPSNPLDNLSKNQIKDIFTGKIKNWKELGGKDLKIVAVSRDSASGTFEAFSEHALDKKRVRPDALTQASNQAVANIISQTPGAIGYVGIGYISDKIKAVKYENIEATKENVLKNKYLLARPLFMYTEENMKPEVKKFIDFIKGPEGAILAQEAGFIPFK